MPNTTPTTEHIMVKIRMAPTIIKTINDDQVGPIRIADADNRRVGTDGLDLFQHPEAVGSAHLQVEQDHLVVLLPEMLDDVPVDRPA